MSKARVTLRLSPPPDEAGSGLMAAMEDDLTMRDVDRLAAVFPGVAPRLAAIALLRDALERAEDLISAGRACATARQNNKAGRACATARQNNKAGRACATARKYQSARRAGAPGGVS